MANSERMHSEAGLVRAGCLVLGALLVCAECGPAYCALGPAEVSQLERSVISIDADGRGVSYGADGAHRMNQREQDAAIGKVMQSIRLDYVRDSVRTVLIRVHGGLNGLSGSGEYAEHVANEIKADARDSSGAVYPVFIDWECGLSSSLWEYLSGSPGDNGNPRRWVGGTIRGVWNILMGTVQLPAALANHQERTAESMRLRYGLPSNLSPTPGPGVRVDPTDSRRRPIFRPFDYLFQSVWDLRLVPQHIAVRGWGRGTYESMRRRVQRLFYTAAEFEREGATDGRRGVVAQFEDSLLALQRANPSIRIVVIGHSMGTQVVAQMLNYAPDLRIASIAFMAAACSMDDYVRVVVPYLHRWDHATFFNLCLSPLAEREEQHWLLSEGSLLLWIDDALTTEVSARDVTLGRADHQALMLAVTPADLSARVFVRVFGYPTSIEPAGKLPTMHGDFSGTRGGKHAGEVQFWSREFVWPDGSEWPIVSRLEEKLK